MAHELSEKCSRKEAEHIAYASVFTVRVTTATGVHPPIDLEDVLLWMSQLGLTFQLDPQTANVAYYRVAELEGLND